MTSKSMSLTSPGKFAPYGTFKINESHDILDQKAKINVLACSKNMSANNHFAVSLSNKTVWVFDTVGV